MKLKHLEVKFPIVEILNLGRKGLFRLPISDHIVQDPKENSIRTGNMKKSGLFISKFRFMVAFSCYPVLSVIDWVPSYWFLGHWLKINVS